MKNKSLFITNNDGNQHQLALQAENKTENTLNFREKIQRDSMIEALEKTNGNVSLAAKLLDVPRSTFYKRMQNISYKVDFVIYFFFVGSCSVGMCAYRGNNRIVRN